MKHSSLSHLPNPHEVPTLLVPEAGRIAFGLGRTASYAAARRGEIPTIRIGGKVLVPTTRLLEMLSGRPCDQAPPQVHAIEPSPRATNSNRRRIKRRRPQDQGEDAAA
ncbi:helix-turn-helix domain-containing protein [Streptomyces sp. ET3-23]|uniref:helix-turn-helix domain-containing protein n=1 Tax=Streptomyces sp. ET3-23 TaxID=2885643 RepID=UPI001D10FF60|nr:helix-turn-helix domain-containing protein [Streptomyces sp. ET3-23]MCC2280277.1 helix-turn-helix domain-containing protein [Streptomyces sp. ET3-23]